MKKIFPFLAMAGILLSGCTDQTLDDLVPVEDDGPDIVTYVDVQPIFNNNCTNCHSNPPQNGAPMPLITYDNAVDAVMNRDLIDRISRNEGESGLMPKGGARLPQSTINMVVDWQSDGFLEN